MLPTSMEVSVNICGKIVSRVESVAAVPHVIPLTEYGPPPPAQLLLGNPPILVALVKPSGWISFFLVRRRLLIIMLDWKMVRAGTNSSRRCRWTVLPKWQWQHKMI